MTIDVVRLRRSWLERELPAAVFETARALTWALGFEDDPLAWSLALSTLLARHRGGVRTPLRTEALADVLGLGPDDAETRRALAAGVMAEENHLWATPAGPMRPWVREGALVTTRRLYAWSKELESEVDRRSTPHVPASTVQVAGLTREQESAVQAALVQPMSLVTGGPGTGKTTALAALVDEARRRGEVVALGAPTGKAAQRLRAALRARGGVSAAVEAQTVHRLLGIADRAAVAAAGERPLEADLVIIDEASMLELELLVRVFRSLREEARLVLVGDPRQLPPIDAGAPFAELVAKHEGLARHLTKNLRVRPTEGGRRLASWADAIRREESPLPTFEAALPPLDAEGIFGVELTDDGRARRGLWRSWHETRGLLPPPDASAADQLATVERSRILTVVREGPHGSLAINRDLVQLRGLGRDDRSWAPGQPLIVKRNLYASRLFNGDLGIVIDDPSGGRRLLFDSGEGPRTFDVESLREHVEGADALTVHKAQGSEFDWVLVWLGSAPHSLATRELVYTAVTRARRQVVIAGRADVLAEALKRRARPVTDRGARPA